MDTVTRIAHCVGRAVHASPGITPGRARKALPGRDRPHFIDATMLAARLDLIRVADLRLFPGAVTPAPRMDRPAIDTASQLAAALAAVPA